MITCSPDEKKVLYLIEKEKEVIDNYLLEHSSGQATKIGSMAAFINNSLSKFSNNIELTNYVIQRLHFWKITPIVKELLSRLKPTDLKKETVLRLSIGDPDYKYIDLFAYTFGEKASDRTDLLYTKLAITESVEKVNKMVHCLGLYLTNSKDLVHLVITFIGL